MRLHLVRHGQSTWNVERRLQGQSPGVPLTKLGRAQARDAADALRAAVGWPELWSSDLLRASETAEIIGAQLGLVVRYDERLREQQYGVLEGRLTSELTAEPTPEGCHVTEVAWGGGESIEQVYSRVRSFVLDLAVDEAILVTHGDTLRVTLALVDQLNRGEPDERPHRLVTWPIVPNGSVTSVEFSSELLGDLCCPVREDDGRASAPDAQ